MLKQSLQQKLLQKLSPQQIQLMKLLQVPAIELEQRIKEELESNPALEEGAEEMDEDASYETDAIGADSEGEVKNEDFDLSQYLSDDEIPDYKLSIRNHGADDDNREIPIGSGKSFQETLLSQLGLRTLSEHQRMLAENIIGNLDDSGYLRREIPSMVNDLAFTQNIRTNQEELLEVLRMIQDLDPPGVGARDLRECLLLQIRRIENFSETKDLAEVIVRDFFEEFTRKHYDKIQKRLGIDDEELKDAIELIIHLNPKPGNSMQESSRAAQQIIPDFTVAVEDEKLVLLLNQRNAPDLRISRQYREMLESYAASKGDAKQKEAVQFVKQKIDAAKWFIDAILQRQQTLYITMSAILEYQKEYFLTGDETKLKPMILKDISELVNMDISTISRVANSKYVQTPYGTRQLKFFFSEGLSTESGEEVSTREVKKILQEAIEAEDKRKPLTDDRLMQLLQEKGYNIARRTVAKYREQLDIPVARLRKEL